MLDDGPSASKVASTRDAAARDGIAHDAVARDRVASDVVARALEGMKLELIAETYDILKSVLRMGHDEMRGLFSDWSLGELSDPLVAAAADVLGQRDEDGAPLLEKVLDVERGSSLCRDSAALALELGVPAPMTAEAACSASFAAMKDERIGASAVLTGPRPAPTGDRRAMVEELRRAFLAAAIIAYAESSAILSAAGLDRVAATQLPAGDGGSFVAQLAAAARARRPGASLLLDAQVKSCLDPLLPSLRRVSARGAESGTHAPLFAAALTYYDSLRRTWMPANMVAALRDRREGAGFERVDRPRGDVFHSTWD